MPANSFSMMPAKLNCNVGADLWEFRRAVELEDRRLYLYGTIFPIDAMESFCVDTSSAALIAEMIIDYNRQDEVDKVPIEKRKAIRLYINSPGGDLTEGFALVSAIELSKTPVYTINVGDWSSMAFLIGIAGTKRFSLKNSTFMMHEPSSMIAGKFSDLENAVNFNKKCNASLIKTLVQRHSNITPRQYTRMSKKDYYMLAEEALKYGFIDEIVTDISTIF